jgi:hypothetical protein
MGNPLVKTLSLAVLWTSLAALGCGDDGSATTAGSQAGGQGGSTSGTGSSATAGSGGSGAAPAEAKGCNDVPLLQNPSDTSLPGPWPVGAKTVSLNGLTTEVWYPATLGSESGMDKIIYDPRLWLPASEQSKIPDADNPWQDCDCYRDLPLDGAHGPYPVVLFLHGTAGFRTQSLAQMTHWASRGFVVVACDHPKLYLGDLLQLMFGADQPGDANKLIDALNATTGDIAFLAGHIDMTHLGMAGHSAGGNAVSGFGNTPGMRVLIPMAAGGTQAGSSLESTLVMGALNDAVVAYTSQTNGYGSSPARKRLVGIGNAGHLAFSDLCALSNTNGQDLIEIAQMYQIQNSQFATMLWDGCADGQLDPLKSIEIVNYATSAALEEALQCSAAGDGFAQIRMKYSDVAEYQEQL